jgi:hypothetical protein
MSAGLQWSLAGAAATTAVHLGSRPWRSNAQVDPKTNGATASRKGCRQPAEPCWIVSRRGVGRCLSRMRRKSHVRFLGEGALATAPPYPTYYPRRAEDHGPAASLPGSDWQREAQASFGRFFPAGVICFSLHNRHAPCKASERQRAVRTGQPRAGIWLHQALVALRNESRGAGGASPAVRVRTGQTPGRCYQCRSPRWGERSSAEWASTRGHRARRGALFSWATVAVQDRPVRFRSARATLWPRLAAVSAAVRPHGPPPITTRSYTFRGRGGCQSGGWTWAICRRFGASKGAILAADRSHLVRIVGPRPDGPAERPAEAPLAEHHAQQRRSR